MESLDNGRIGDGGMVDGEVNGEVDAVVVGAGASGGVAAMVLAEAGLRVLVLDAGPDRTPGATFGWEPLNSLKRMANLSSGRQRRQASHPGYWKANPDLYVDEQRQPYSTPDDAPFLWSRGRQVGGRSLTWGGITLRLSDHEFQAGLRDGHGPAWPIGSRDLDPWYSRLERLLGVHGGRDGLPQLPDGESLEPPLPFTPGERHLKVAVGRELGLPLIHSRGFALHRRSRQAPWPRSSAQGVTLARARATGRVHVRDLMVTSHLHRGPEGRVEGVVAINARSGQRELLRAPLVVLCASTIETLRILLHTQEIHPEAPLDHSGTLGRHLMDHISSSRFFSLPDIPAPKQPAELSGAGSCFIPNTLNLGDGAADDDRPGFLRGYGLWTAVQRLDPPAPFRRYPREALGFLIGHGEVLPDPENRVSLDPALKDAWGLPAPRIRCRWGTNEAAMVAHMQARMAAVVAAAGGRILPLHDLVRLPLVEPLVRNSPALAPGAAPPGYYIHELGGARMANNREGGVVDPWNRCWAAPNVLITDGACWPSAGWQSPTLTIMAITWRACAAAAAAMGRGQGLLTEHGDLCQR